MNRADVGMIQRGQQLRLAREARQPLGVRRKRGRQPLQRDVPLQPGIPRAKHLAHAACAKGAKDFVCADASAREHEGILIEG